MKSSKTKIKLARRLIESGNYYCPLCGYAMTFKTCNIDHIIPKCRGGTNAMSNLQLVHSECNQRKGSKLQRGYSDIQYPVLNGRKKTKMLARAAANGNDYAKMLRKRMNQYYEEVNARYEEIHPL